MEKFYTLNIAGVERKLPLCKVADNTYIAALMLLGDAEFSTICAEELLKIVPEHDVIITAEAKGITLAHEMVRLQNKAYYVVARKAKKLYMKDLVEVNVNSITTDFDQKLYISGSDAEAMQGKRVLVVDDVVSTGGSLAAIEKLALAAGANIVGKATVLAEGDARGRADLIYLQELALFNEDGSAK